MVQAVWLVMLYGQHGSWLFQVVWKDNTKESEENGENKIYLKKKKAWVILFQSDIGSLTGKFLQ